MRVPPDDDNVQLPFPVAPVSNGEWCPLPITDRQRRLARVIVERPPSAPSGTA
jgi:hypothetical protein